MEGLGTAYFGERSSSAGGILSKNNMKRRDGFQFITPERNETLFGLSALLLLNSLLQDTAAGKDIQQNIFF